MDDPHDRQAVKCTSCGWATKYLAVKTAETRICPFCNKKKLVPWIYG